jgi:lysophospholipase L1-like esterase
MKKFFGFLFALVAVLYMLSACDLTDTTGVTKPQVIILGDSVFDLSAGISDRLKYRSGDVYRDNTVSGAKLDYIANTEYPAAKSEDKNIRTVIMNGGGNDLLQDTQKRCATTGSLSTACKTLLNGLSTAQQKLFAQMVKDGVKNIIYLEYYYPTGSYVNLSKANDYSINFTNLNCAAVSAPTKCYTVDPRAAFTGHPEYIKSDNIHPTTAGSNVLGDMIWDVMVKNNIEQD